MTIDMTDMTIDVYRGHETTTEEQDSKYAVKKIHNNGNHCALSRRLRLLYFKKDSTICSYFNLKRVANL